MFLLLSTVALFAIEPDDRFIRAKGDCSKNWEGVYKLMDSKIGESNFSIKSNIGCREIEQINKYNPDSVLITSGRRKREFVICLSNEKTIPCKHIVGILKGYADPATSIAKVFGLKRPKPKYLNETIERFYFSPNLLYGPESTQDER